jgi:hypothetical protein
VDDFWDHAGDYYTAEERQAMRELAWEAESHGAEILSLRGEGIGV